MRQKQVFRGSISVLLQYERAIKLQSNSWRAETMTDSWEDCSGSIYIWSQWDNICCSIRGHIAVRLSGGEKVVGWSRASASVRSNWIATQQRKEIFLGTKKSKFACFPLSQQILFFRDICCLFYNVQQCTALSLTPRSSNRCFKLVFGPNQQDSGQPKAGYDDLGMRLNKLYFSRNL